MNRQITVPIKLFFYPHVFHEHVHGNWVFPMLCSNQTPHHRQKSIGYSILPLYFHSISIYFHNIPMIEIIESCSIPIVRPSNFPIGLRFRRRSQAHGLAQKHGPKSLRNTGHFSGTDGALTGQPGHLSLVHGTNERPWHDLG